MKFLLPREGSLLGSGVAKSFISWVNSDGLVIAAWNDVLGKFPAPHLARCQSTSTGVVILASSFLSMVLYICQYSYSLK